MIINYVYKRIRVFHGSLEGEETRLSPDVGVGEIITTNSSTIR